MDWIGMPADTTSKAENHLTWQKNLSCDCVDLLHNGFVQIAKLIWFQDYLSCPSCILHWILFFLTEIELVKICLLADFQELECQPPSSKEVETLPTAIVLDWFAGSPNLHSKLQLTSNKFHERRKITFSQLASWNGAHEVFPLQRVVYLSILNHAFYKK